MRRASAVGAALAAGIALAALPVLPARAGDPPEAPAALRDALARQLADERAAIDRARSAVGAKLGAADAASARRVAAASRLLRAPLGGPAGDPDARMAAARRRAAVRLLLERALVERRLLADEDAALRRAAAEARADAARVPGLELPTGLGRPARGKIARRFGTLLHERSGATLARRGIDLELEPQGAAVAPADGVVRYAGPIRGLDAGVIVDHGAFLTVIGKLGALAVPAGAPVRRGDRLGRAAGRRVYFEVRVKLGAGGRPIDPEPLFRAPRRADPAPPR